MFAYLSVYDAFGQFFLLVGACVSCCRLLKGWFFEGIVEAGPALGGMAAIIMLTGLLWQVQSQAAMLSGAFLLVGGTFAAPFLLRNFEKESRQYLYDKDIEKSRRALEFDPANAGAHALLAENYARSGRIDEAVLEFQAAIELNPASPNVGKWKRQLREITE